MRRRLSIVGAVLVVLAAHARAGMPACLCHTRCTTPPPPPCPDCSGPCEHRLCLALCGPEHTDQLLRDLTSDNYCARRRAARKLGCRFHADFCTDPRVLEALIAALQCDTCWEVRYAAAWALHGQDARTPPGLLALYISSRLDPHYMVRTRSAEALDLLTLGRAACYKDLFASGDKLLQELREKKYVPGTEKCRVLLGDACSRCGIPTLLSSAPSDGKRTTGDTASTGKAKGRRTGPAEDK